MIRSPARGDVKSTKLANEWKTHYADANLAIDLS